MGFYGFFYWLDRKIIAFFERRVFHPLQLWTGKDNFYYANFLLGAVAALDLIQLWQTGFWVTFKTAGQIFRVVLSFTFTVFIFTRIEYHSVRWLARQGHNPNKDVKTLCFARSGCVVFAVCESLFSVVAHYVFSLKWERGEVMSMFTFWIFLLFIYALACDPLPPCPGKLGDWFARLFGKKVEN